MFGNAKARNLPTSGPTYETSDRKIGKSDFTALYEWLESFRTIHHVVSKEVCGEAGYIHEATIQNRDCQIVFLHRKL